jgi:hypothetical protein
MVEKLMWRKPTYITSAMDMCLYKPGNSIQISPKNSTTIFAYYFNAYFQSALEASFVAPLWCPTSSMRNTELDDGVNITEPDTCDKHSAEGTTIHVFTSALHHTEVYREEGTRGMALQMLTFIPCGGEHQSHVSLASAPGNQPSIPNVQEAVAGSM